MTGSESTSATSSGAGLGARLKSLVPPAARDAVKPAVRGAAQLSAPLRPPPDFLIIGAKRGGTTSTWNWLLQHPGVLPLVPAMQNLKSSHYFSIHYGKSPGWFRGFFPLASTRALIRARHHLNPVAGEASPYYLFDPRIAARVANELPGVRAIVVLRDPVERAYSHHQERTKEGVETLSFRDALAAEPDRLAGELARMDADPAYYSEPHDWFAYRERGVYAPQLARWREHLPESRILVLQSEELYGDPASTYLRITRFLGLPDHPLRAPKRHNYLPAAPMPADVRADLTSYYRAPNAELADLWGHDPHWS